MSKPLTVVCLLLSLIPSAAVSAAESFGRLFTTPSERSSLDYLRQTTRAPILDEPSQATLEAPPPALIIPDSISMQGYVKRSDGQKGTVWVNNKPMQEDSANGEVEVGRLGRDGNEVKLKVPATGKDFNLKAGQVYLPGNDSVSELNAHSNKSKEVKGTIGDELPVNNSAIQNGIQ